MNGEQILNEVRILIDNMQFARYNEINRAYRRIAHLSPHAWLREESEEKLQVVSGTSEYNINIKGMRRITGLWIYGVDSGEQKWNFVQEVDQKLFEKKAAEHVNLDGEDRPGLPEFFKIIYIQNDQLRVKFTPTPDDTMDCKIDYIKEVSEIGRDTYPEMPPAYHDVIAQLAAGYILRKKGDGNGPILIDEAMQQANQLMMDASANRTLNIDRPRRPWIRSGNIRWGSYGRYENRWRMY